MRDNAATQGSGPIHDDVYLGSDGQLWKWTERGQQLVASSGINAVAYARLHGWPEWLVGRIRSLGNRWKW